MCDLECVKLHIILYPRESLFAKVYFSISLLASLLTDYLLH